MKLEFNFSLEQNLSSLGDSFTNFIYSVALSNYLKKPVGKKVSNRSLALALKEAGLREKLGSRKNFHTLGNYAEDIIFRAWAGGKITLEECIRVLQGNLGEGEVKAFAELLREIKCREGLP